MTGCSESGQGMPRSWYLALASAAVCVAACQPDADSPNASSVPVTSVERRVLSVTWDTVVDIGGGVQDSLLLRPRLLVARDGRIVAYDYYDERLKAFDIRSGALLWSFGGDGDGPGEFKNAFDIEVASDGKIWVLDYPTNRLTAVTPDGILDRIVPLGGMTGRDVVPLSDRVIVTAVAQGDTFLVEFDDSDISRAVTSFPLEEIRKAHLMMRQPHASLHPDGITWAIIYPYGEPFVVFRGDEVVCTGRLIEGSALPEALDPEATIWAVDEAVSDSSLYVLARGQTEDALRLVDEYSITDCTYRRSYKLPMKSNALAVADGAFFMEFEEPAPTILGLSPILLAD